RPKSQGPVASTVATGEDASCALLVRIASVGPAARTSRGGPSSGGAPVAAPGGEHPRRARAAPFRPNSPRDRLPRSAGAVRVQNLPAILELWLPYCQFPPGLLQPQLQDRRARGAGGSWGRHTRGPGTP